MWYTINYIFWNYINMMQHLCFSLILKVTKIEWSIEIYDGFFVFLLFFFHFFTIIFFFSTKNFCIFYNEYSIILLCIYNDSTSSLGGTFEPPFSTFEPPLSTFEPWVQHLVLITVLLNLERDIWSSIPYFWTSRETFEPI